MSPISLIVVAILNILCISYFLYRDYEWEKLLNAQEESLNALRQKNIALEELTSVLRHEIDRMTNSEGK